MGWMYEQRYLSPYGDGEKVSDLISAVYTFENDSVKSEVLDVAIVKLRTAYLAVRMTYKDEGRSYVYAGVALLDYRKNEYYNFGYKDMEETMGPCESECPERILKLLSPVEEISPHDSSREYARKWRQSCVDKINKRQAAPALKTGHYLVMKTPLNYGGIKKERMLITNAKRRIGDGRYRIPSKARLVEYGYDVMAPEKVKETA